ncbi:MAG: hypothetical protein ACK57G_10230 [Planctomycetota bacterium]
MTLGFHADSDSPWSIPAPSVVARLEDGQILVGDAARELRVTKRGDRGARTHSR